MNVGQALASVLPGVPVRTTRPESVPRSPYVIVTELADGKERQFYVDTDGHAPQVRRLTLLLTLYGPPWNGNGDPLAALRPLYRKLRSVGDLITEHPELPPLRGVERGAEVPPQEPATDMRAWAACRILLQYIE